MVSYSNLSLENWTELSLLLHMKKLCAVTHHAVGMSPKSLAWALVQ